MITVDEYKKRIQENTVEWYNQKTTNSFDITKYHGVDATAGSVNTILLLKKTHDIYAALILGFLPYILENTGADAVRLDAHGYTDVELKTCYAHISPSTAFKTERDTIYCTKDVGMWGKYVDKNKTQILESTFSAAFRITHNLQTKNRDTYIIAIDGTDGCIIDIYSLEGNLVVDYLKTSNDIKLGSFLSKGTKVASPVEVVKGWYTWVDGLLPLLETKVCEPPPQRARREQREKDHRDYLEYLAKAPERAAARAASKLAREQALQHTSAPLPNLYSIV